jgi:hypothetical protein
MGLRDDASARGGHGDEWAQRRSPDFEIDLAETRAQLADSENRTKLQ